MKINILRHIWKYQGLCKFVDLSWGSGKRREMPGKNTTKIMGEFFSNLMATINSANPRCSANGKRNRENCARVCQNQLAGNHWYRGKRHILYINKWQDNWQLLTGSNVNQKTIEQHNVLRAHCQPRILIHWTNLLRKI